MVLWLILGVLCIIAAGIWMLVSRLIHAIEQFDKAIKMLSDIRA